MFFNLVSFVLKRNSVFWEELQTEWKVRELMSLREAPTAGACQGQQAAQPLLGGLSLRSERSRVLEAQACLLFLRPRKEKVAWEVESWFKKC